MFSVSLSIIVITARGSGGSIVFSIVAKFFVCFSVNTITHEPLHLAWWNFARTCTSTTSRTLLNFKVMGQRSRSRVFLCVGNAPGNDEPFNERIRLVALAAVMFL